MRFKRTFTGTVFDILNHLFLVILAFTVLFPFWHILVLSLSTPASAMRLGIHFWPSELSFAPIGEVFKNEILLIGYGNTIYRTFFGVILTVTLTLCGAFALTKKELPFRNTITLIFLFTMFFGGGLIPTYMLMRNLGLLGSRWALILPTIASAWYLIIARNYLATIPASLEESALVDGATPIQVLFKIIFPISMPIIAVIALWSAVSHWNAWFDAMIYVRQREKMVLQLVLRRILIEQSEEFLSSGILREVRSNTTPVTIRSAIILVTIGPIVAAYPFLQKYFVKGILIGSLKG